MSNSIIHLTDETFQKTVLESNIPVLVDYWAEWCGPCKMIAPILESLVSEYEGKLIIAKHNIDDSILKPAKTAMRMKARQFFFSKINNSARIIKGIKAAVFTFAL